MNKESITSYLDSLFEDPICELNYTKDYELVLSVMLSAQTTDKGVNRVTKELYKKYDSLEKLNTLSVKEIESYIKSIGFYRNKSLNFKGMVER
jgi:endonuclease-3